jgi:phosphoglycolate phosphatase
MDFREIKAVMFDFDMTLMDTSHIITECTNQLADRYGLRRVTRDEMLAIIGIPIAQSWMVIWGRYEDEWLEYYREHFRGMEHAGFREFPDTRSAVSRIRRAGVRTAVVTNRKFARSAVEQGGIAELFDVIIGLEDVANPKPHPEPILTALERLAERPADAVYIGDTDIDMRAAAAARVAGVGVTTGNFGAEALRAAGAVHVCENLAGVSELICGSRPEGGRIRPV